MEVWFMTVVENGHINLTSLMAENQYGAVNQVIENSDVLNMIEHVVSPDIIVWTSLDLETTKITLIRA